jgi:hypothetical protein
MPSTESIIAVREDGAKTEWNKVAKLAHAGYAQRILDFPSAGERTVVDLLAGSKTTTRETPARVNARAEYIAQGKYGNCMGNPNPRMPFTRTLDGIEDLQGIRTVRIKDVYSNSEQIETSWLAPEYNCLLVQQLSTEGKLEYHRRVKSAKFGEPDKSLFEVPSGLIETSPSGAERARN